MNVSLSKSNLESGITTVQNVIAPRSVNPILSNMFLEATGDTLRIVATDQQVLIENVIECQVAEEGAITLPARRLSELARELPEEPVNLKLESNNRVELQCGKVLYRMLGMPADEFPSIPTFAEASKVLLKGKDLADVLRKVSFATAVDQSRIALTGMLMEVGEGKVKTIATDGRRLAYAEHEADVPEGFSASVLIPKKAINELTRLVAPEEDTDIYIGENLMAIKFGPTTLMSRLIEGHFPNYHQIIPSGYPNRVVATTAELQKALRRASIMTDEKYRLTRLRFVEGCMMLRTNTPDVGEAEDEVPVEYTGAEIEIGFNPYFILDILKTIDTEQVTIELKDSASAAVLRPLEDDKYVHVIMPIKV